MRLISTLLEPAGRHDGKPAQLAENAGVAFQGCVVLGMGFVLEPTEAETWLAEDERNREVLFPYLNGEDLNSRPDCSPSRWVIDFNDRCATCARRYLLPYKRVDELVRPERAKNNRKVYRDYWWQFGEKRPAMRRAIADLDEVLVIALVSKTVMPMRVPTGEVFSHKLAVFATDSFADQAVLSSSSHQMWAVKYGSTMRADVNYSPSDVFVTFPRPEPTPELESAGVALDTQRREVMLRRDTGLTKLYNLVNDPEVIGDPDVDLMRQLHVELDEAVSAAYGWSNVELDHGFHTYRQVQRWTISPAARVDFWIVCWRRICGGRRRSRSCRRPLVRRVAGARRLWRRRTREGCSDGRPNDAQPTEAAGVPVGTRAGWHIGDGAGEPGRHLGAGVAGAGGWAGGVVADQSAADVPGGAYRAGEAGGATGSTSRGLEDADALTAIRGDAVRADRAARRPDDVRRRCGRRSG